MDAWSIRVSIVAAVVLATVVVATVRRVLAAQASLRLRLDELEHRSKETGPAPGRGEGGLKSAHRDMAHAVRRMSDIVRSKTREVDALARERTLLDLVVSALPDPVFVQDAQGAYCVVNDAFCRFVRLGRVEILGKTDRDVLPAQLAASFETRGMTVLATGQAMEAEESFADPERGDRWVSTKFATLKLVDGGQGIVGVVRDVTDRKQTEVALASSEAQFRSSLEHAPTGIAVLDTDGCFREVNAALCRFLGHDVDDLLGKSFLSVIHPSHRAEDEALFAAMMASDGTFERHETRCTHRSGHDVWGQLGAAVVRDAHARPLAVIVQIEDIKERKLAEDALIRARDAAEEGARVKSEFLANMSHEIRTPMTAVLGYADLLLDPELTPVERSLHVRTIRRNGEHLLAIINDILDLSKIEAGKMTLEAIDCSPCQIVGEAASLMRVRATEKRLAFDVVYKTAVPETLRTDPTRLRQILVNLVGNAIKFTSEGRVCIEVDCSGRDGPRPEVAFHVVDTGVGMSDDQRARLFRAFTQADTSTTRKFGGSGLGLVISQRLAAMLGGGISVSSVLGKGTTFTLRLPFDADETTRWVAHAAEAVRGAPSARPAAGALSLELDGTILVAEDGLDNQRLLSTYLRRAGARVTLAANGLVAVGKALEAEKNGSPYSVIFMDIQMPELDGYEATARLRSEGYRGAIVALTAHAMIGDRERCVAVGCDDYLTKPVDRAALISMAARWGAGAAHPPPASTRRPSHHPRAPLPAVDETVGASAPSDPADAVDEPLHSSFADDPDMAELVELFVAELPDCISELRAAFAAGDLSALRALAHQIKGAAGGYGFPSITDLAAHLEVACIDDPSRVDAAFGSLVQTCKRVRRGLRPSAELPRTA